MLIDVGKLMTDLGPRIEEIAARVGALKPGEKTSADLTVTLPADVDYSDAGVPLAVHAAVFDAIALHSDAPVLTDGWRSTRYSDLVIVNYAFRVPAAPTAEDFQP